MKQTLTVYNPNRREIIVETIKYVEGNGNYSFLHTASHKPILLSRSIGGFEDKLPTFIRIHKRYFVNPQFIVHHQPPAPNRLAITLTSGEVLAVSRRRIPQVLAALTQPQ